MNSEVAFDTDAIGPLDTIEAVATTAAFDAQRIDETELHVTLAGGWRDVSVWFAWREEAQVLQIGAPLELKVPQGSRAAVNELLALVNERLWLGHFDHWERDHGLIYRNGAVLPAGQVMDASQAEILLRGALDAFEKFYPAFNYVVWGGKSAREAIDMCVLETVGTA